MCDDNCKVVLTKNKLTATKDDKTVLEGRRNFLDGLWDIPVTKKCISPTNYEQPPIHPSLYASIVEIAPVVKKRPTKKLQSMPQAFQSLGDLAEENAFENILHTQERHDKNSFAT